jgi:hypothetical protein
MTSPLSAYLSGMASQRANLLLLLFILAGSSAEKRKAKKVLNNLMIKEQK